MFESYQKGIFTCSPLAGQQIINTIYINKKESKKDRKQQKNK